MIFNRNRQISQTPEMSPAFAEASPVRPALAQYRERIVEQLHDFVTADLVDTLNLDSAADPLVSSRIIEKERGGFALINPEQPVSREDFVRNTEQTFDGIKKLMSSPVGDLITEASHEIVANVDGRGVTPMDLAQSRSYYVANKTMDDLRANGRRKASRGSSMPDESIVRKWAHYSVQSAHFVSLYKKKLAPELQAERSNLLVDELYRRVEENIDPSARRLHESGGLQRICEQLARLQTPDPQYALRLAGMVMDKYQTTTKRIVDQKQQQISQQDAVQLARTAATHAAIAYNDQRSVRHRLEGSKYVHEMTIEDIKLSEIRHAQMRTAEAAVPQRRRTAERVAQANELTKDLTAPLYNKLGFEYAALADQETRPDNLERLQTAGKAVMVEGQVFIRKAGEIGGDASRRLAADVIAKSGPAAVAAGVVGSLALGLVHPQGAAAAPRTGQTSASANFLPGMDLAAALADASPSTLGAGLPASVQAILQSLNPTRDSTLAASELLTPPTPPPAPVVQPPAPAPAPQAPRQAAPETNRNQHLDFQYTPKIEQTINRMYADARQIGDKGDRGLVRRQVQALEFLMKRGFDPKSATAIIGNLTVESGVNPKQDQYGNGPGRGIAQWTVDGRWRGLVRFCNDRKMDARSLDGQLEFLLHEARTESSVMDTIPRVVTSSTLRSKVVAFEREFEKAGKPNIGARYDAAVRIFERFNLAYQLTNIIPEAPSVVTPPAPTPPSQETAPAPAPVIDPGIIAINGLFDSLSATPDAPAAPESTDSTIVADATGTPSTPDGTDATAPEIQSIADIAGTDSSDPSALADEVLPAFNETAPDDAQQLNDSSLNPNAPTDGSSPAPDGQNTAPAPGDQNTPAAPLDGASADKPAEQGAEKPKDTIQPNDNANKDAAPKSDTREGGSTCAAGSISVGIQDVYNRGKVSKQELCAIVGLPSSGSESTPGSKFYVRGAEGNAIILAKYSKSLVDMLTAAKADGVNLKALSSFRSHEHQVDLCNSNDGCRSGTSNKWVAKPGRSEHEGAKAIDYLDTNHGRGSNCTGNHLHDGKCVAPDSKIWRWLNANASKFGFTQYVHESWHWEPAN